MSLDSTTDGRHDVASNSGTMTDVSSTTSSSTTTSSTVPGTWYLCYSIFPKIRHKYDQHKNEEDFFSTPLFVPASSHPAISTGGQGLWRNWMID